MKYFIAWWVHMTWRDSLLLVSCAAIIAILFICIVRAMIDRQTRGLLRIVEVDPAQVTGQFYAVGRDVKKL